MCSSRTISSPGAFDAGIPHKGGEFKVIEEKKDYFTTVDDEWHDVRDEKAAYSVGQPYMAGNIWRFL